MGHEMLNQQTVLDQIAIGRADQLLISVKKRTVSDVCSDREIDVPTVLGNDFVSLVTQFLRCKPQ
ncbi:hypothetical protein D3C81_2248610 [compost metagenome]